ncbi:MAG: SRPBCC domain-containing protein [Chitinophagaceae bacterium]|nr:SRPBCC domain-containing protein [Chitinophagaceae bacterium]
MKDFSLGWLNNSAIEIKNMIQDETFEISYLFKTDMKKAFEMWTDPTRFSSWLGPDGAEMTFLAANVVEGGTSFWTMTTNDGMTKFGQINYKTIKPNQLLVYTQNFCDKDGNFVKAPFADTYPDYLLTTVHFSEEENTTKVTVKWTIYGDATEQEKQTFTGMRALMKAGWTDSFQKVDRLLEQNQ